MKKELSISQLFKDCLKFVGNNLVLLSFLAFLSFAGSYCALWAGISRNFFYLVIYGLFIYCFYYIFTALYFQKRPLFTAERLVNSFIKLIITVAISFLILVICRTGLTMLKDLVSGLAVFPDFYDALRRFYHYILSTGLYSICVYLGVIGLLTFSFFIPMFSWIDAVNDKESSLFTAYTNVSGNYMKTLAVFLFIYGVVPLLISLAGLMMSRTALSVLYAVQTVFQLVVYLHLYDVFYVRDCDEEM